MSCSGTKVLLLLVFDMTIKSAGMLFCVGHTALVQHFVYTYMIMKYVVAKSIPTAEQT